jgi:6-phosphogluconolactonase
MANQTRRSFLVTASAATVAAAASPSVASPAVASPNKLRVFIASGTPDGILAYDWDPATAELAAAGVAAKISTIDWLAFSPDRKYLYAASEVDSFNGKPTGGVASYSLANGKLTAISQANSASKGTCHLAVDHTGGVLVSADYGGGGAASFRIDAAGKLTQEWTEHYTEHGPNKDRQEAAHAHFASFSPDNRFAYVNDLGGDCIHIYSLNAQTAMLTAAGKYKSHPGDGPRTLHFHPNGHTAYSMNELVSAVDVLAWTKSTGALSLVSRLDLKPDRSRPTSTGCDTVITKDGRFVYFANRGDDYLFACKADVKSGALTPMGRSSCGGKTPRNFTLDPTERWMLVANQNSDNISVFARNTETGVLGNEGKSFAAKTPMCILFA